MQKRVQWSESNPGHTLVHVVHVPPGELSGHPTNVVHQKFQSTVLLLSSQQFKLRRLGLISNLLDSVWPNNPIFNWLRGKYVSLASNKNMHSLRKTLK